MEQALVCIGRGRPELRAQIYPDDIICNYPQSGERIRGRQITNMPVADHSPGEPKDSFRNAICGQSTRCPHIGSDRSEGGSARPGRLCPFAPSTGRKVAACLKSRPMSPQKSVAHYRIVYKLVGGGMGEPRPRAILQERFCRGIDTTQPRQDLALTSGECCILIRARNVSSTTDRRMIKSQAAETGPIPSGF
jgi:hypothetical protein